ncbi:MAG: Zn-dependent exopeptidase M28, partial [Chloroflexi bacterium]|nr:Zn-dependent exopeptidase M28 [Chloroflexota bacterium]
RDDLDQHKMTLTPDAPAWLDSDDILTAELLVDAAIVGTTSQNVVGTLPGPGDRVVVLGGHYDSVSEGPGANDNASGTATVLELARVLAATRSSFAVRAVLFGAEEIGLVGSRAYVASLPPAERARIVAMLNFDMVGVGDRATVSGSTELVGLAVEAAERLGMRVGGSAGGRGRFGSDHGSFLEAGVPALFFYRGEDPRYHTADDRAQHVEARHLEAAGRLALALLDRLAAR